MADYINCNVLHKILVYQNIDIVIYIVRIFKFIISFLPKDLYLLLLKSNNINLIRTPIYSLFLKTSFFK